MDFTPLFQLRISRVVIYFFQHNKISLGLTTNLRLPLCRYILPRVSYLNQNTSESVYFGLCFVELCTWCLSLPALTSCSHCTFHPQGLCYVFTFSTVPHLPKKGLFRCYTLLSVKNIIIHINSEDSLKRIIICISFYYLQIVNTTFCTSTDQEM